MKATPKQLGFLIGLYRKFEVEKTMEDLAWMSSMDAHKEIQRVKEALGSGNKDDGTGKMRKKIIHLLASAGMTVSSTGKPDYKRIDDFVASIGSNNPDRKKLWKLSKSELVSVTSQVEALYKKATSKHG